MPLPVTHAKYQEFERRGVPLIKVNGLVCIALWRAAAAFDLTPDGLLRRITKGPPVNQEPQTHQGP